MDVTATGLTDVPEVGRTASVSPPRKPKDTPEKKAATPAKEPPKDEWEPRSSLKFSLRAADIDAKFEIHKATSKVIMTMYDRQTGEVLREVPSRRVLDMLASLTPNGQRVDTTS
jgi:uncharacterized FlaG/YvyC family protein